MQKILLVGIGGFIGASLRYIISLACAKLSAGQFPYGTLTVNVLGGFLIGFIMELSISTELISPSLRLLITTGILGGLTTFSTFSYETVEILTEGRYVTGILNIILNFLLSLSGVVLGKIASDVITVVK